jgi:hypothetical protein
MRLGLESRCTLVTSFHVLLALTGNERERERERERGRERKREEENANRGIVLTASWIVKSLLLVESGMTDTALQLIVYFPRPTVHEHSWYANPARNAATPLPHL